MIHQATWNVTVTGNDAVLVFSYEGVHLASGGGGGVGGAVIGGAIGGGKGALIGGIIGGVGGLIAETQTKGEEATVKAGTEFGVYLNQSISLPRFVEATPVTP